MLGKKLGREGASNIQLPQISPAMTFKTQQFKRRLLENLALIFLKQFSFYAFFPLFNGLTYEVFIFILIFAGGLHCFRCKICYLPK